jgi:hypothetical protein
VLVLWGTLDVILLPRQGRRFERLIPNAELRYLKGLGHVRRPTIQSCWRARSPSSRRGSG